MREFERRENESKEEYINRIYSSKIDLGITNQRCAEIINKELNTNVCESYLRGIHKNFNLGYMAGYDKALESINNDDLLAQYEEKRDNS